MSTLEEYQKTGQEFYDKLRLLTYPLAIKYIKDEGEIPEFAIRPSKIKQKLSLCQAFTLSRRWGRTVGMTFEDNYCITSSLVHGWKKMAAREIFNSQVKSKYHESAKAELNIQLQFQDFLNKESSEKLKGNIGLVISPLNKTEIIPDVILVYGNPAQMTTIIHALTYQGKYLVKNQNIIGYGESCIRGVILPFISNKSQVVLPGTGDRTLAYTTENEMAFGMPAKRIFYITKNLFKSAAKLNMGMPTKFMMLNLPEGSGPAAYRYLRRRLNQFNKKKN